MSKPHTTADSKIRGQWSSKLSFILATTGAAVGLGNIWKFPYMAGDNGGSAFVMVYLICVVLIGLPVMLSEMIIGRRGRANPVNALKKVALEAKHSKAWGLLGFWGAATLLIVLSFYSVVAGWSLAYIFRALSGEFNGLNAKQISLIWTNFLGDPWQLLVWHGIFMFITLFVVARGVQSGIEKAANIMMPLLFFILIILVGYATGTGGFEQAVHFLFDFNYHKITADVVIAAMGHAFFTLAIGAGCMLVYGSYLKHHIHLGGAVLAIAGLDVLVALLAGLAIFPIIFAHHLTPAGGPGLMFQILPIAFAKMGGGQWFGALFFILLLFAAWTSSLSLAEPLVILLIEKYHKSRLSAAILVGVVAWSMGIVSLLSFNTWQHFKLFGQWNLFTAITDLATNIMLPIGGILFAIFAAWVMPKYMSQQELAFPQQFLYQIWRFLTRFVAPIAILIILIAALI